MQFRRRATVPNYKDYQRYRELLREDFRQFCAYCIGHENEMGGSDHYEIDHHRPKKKFPELVGKYSNLYYCCRGCNKAKGKQWPSPDLLKLGYRFFDPVAENAYVLHLREEYGKLRPRTRVGKYSIDRIRLNREFLIDLRQRRAIHRTRLRKGLARLQRAATTARRRGVRPSSSVLKQLESVSQELRARPVLGIISLERLVL